MKVGAAHTNIIARIQLINRNGHPKKMTSLCTNKDCLSADNITHYKNENW